jgi:hypothetical protein
MKRNSLPLLILACIALLFIAGCTSQPQPVNSPAGTAAITATPVTSVPVPSQVPATSVTTVPPTTADTLPKEVSQPPSQYAVDIGIVKDRVYSTITVTFLGGPGQIFVKEVLVRVTRPDGVVEQKQIPIQGQIATGTSVDLPGTKGSDRVEVFATINGVLYKVRDENAVYAVY